MTQFTVTLRARDNVLVDYVVEADSASDAMDMVFDRVPFDIKEAWCEDEYYC